MNEADETKLKDKKNLTPVRILYFIVGLNFLWYLIDIFTGFPSDANPANSSTLSGFLLDSSPNWQIFLIVRLFYFIFSFFFVFFLFISWSFVLFGNPLTLISIIWKKADVNTSGESNSVEANEQLVDEKTSESAIKSLLRWILGIPVGIGFTMYLTDIFFNFIHKFERGEPITLSGFFLGNSSDWNSFWTYRLDSLAFGLLCAVLAFIYYRYIGNK